MSNIGELTVFIATSLHHLAISFDFEDSDARSKESVSRESNTFVTKVLTVPTCNNFDKFHIDLDP